MTQDLRTAPPQSTADPIAIARRVLATEMDGLQALSASIGDDFAEAVARIRDLKGRLICAGVGKSGHIARKIAATLASTGTPAQFVHPTEASHGDLGMITPDDAVLALSKSGETRELADLLAYSRRFSIPLIAMTCKRDSLLGRESDLVLECPDAPEACGETRAPTTSTTMMLALGDALAVALLETRGFTASDFRAFHPGGTLGGALSTVANLMHAGDEVPTVGPDAPMSEALIAMSAKRFGCVGVVGDDGVLVGIVTDGDLRRHMGPDLLTQTAGDVMTKAPRVTRPTALAAEALRLMTEVDPRVTVLFVVDDARRPVGIIHMHDCLRAGVA
jgi:arabinose-5-phosphate isomerase